MEPGAVDNLEFDNIPERDISSCRLVDPSAKETDFKKIDNVVYTFGDIFNADCLTIIAIPSFEDGFLYKIIQNDIKNKQSIMWDASNSDENEIIKIQKKYKIEIHATTHRNTPFCILFKYSYKVGEWNELFECIFAMLYKLLKDNINKYDLIFPTFGTNNGISFHDCAFGLYYGLSYFQKIPEHPISKFKTVKVITPYSENKQSTSCRTILHIFNMIDMQEKSAKSSLKCMACLDNPSTIIFPCGHAILCHSCNKKLLTQGVKTCIVCKTLINKYYESIAPTKVACLCHIDNKASASAKDSKCDKKESEITYIPCGHTNVLCVSCENKNKDKDKAKTTCKLCNEEIHKKIHIYSF